MYDNVSSVQDINMFEKHIPARHALLSDEVTLVFIWLFHSVMCVLVDVFGIITNIINIICFIKQGFNDPVNVSFFGLAVADLICLITLIWTNICVNPAFSQCDLPFDSNELQYLTGAMPHATFTRITAWITVLITLERCLCITVPLKVKNVVTSRRVSIIIVSVFIVLISSSAPVYIVNKLGMKFYPQKNKTIIGLIFTEDREQVESVAYLFNNVFIPFTAFVVVIICTTILVIKLKDNTKWRSTSTATTQSDKLSNRNLKVAKMVVMISTLFIVCFFPVSILYMVMALVPEFSLNGHHRNLLFFFGGIGVILESINSSINIFFYFHMSSRYRTSFCTLFGMKGKSGNILHNTTPSTQVNESSIL